MIRKMGQWLCANIGDERVIMSTQTSHYLGLNAMGSRILDLLEQPRTLQDLCDRLLLEFDVPAETCHLEVEGFVRKLAAFGAVSIDD